MALVSRLTDRLSSDHFAGSVRSLAKRGSLGALLQGEGGDDHKESTKSKVEDRNGYLGASEATIFSKRGSPRSGSQKGSSFSAP
jgi:hypothetical protein